MVKKAHNLWRNFKSTLVREFVKKRRNPFEEYEFLDRDNWNGFVAKKTTPESLVFEN